MASEKRRPLELVVRTEISSQSDPAPRESARPLRERLTPAEELALAQRVRNGDTRAKQRMVECNLGLVHALARPYRGRGVALEDLIQEGTLGLLRAIEGFDPSRGVKLSTYAAWWIKRSLFDALAASQPIRLPSQAAQRLAAVRRAEEELRHAGVLCVSSEMIAQRTGLSTSTVQMLRESAHVTSSLDEPRGGEARTLGELIADPGETDPVQELTQHEVRREAWSLLGKLPRRHRIVLIRRYGIGGGRVHSHREIGPLIGVKEERSRQLEREALQRLRELVAAPRRAA